MLGRASAISRTLPRRGRQTAQAPIHSALSSANDVRLDVWMRDRMSGIQVTHDVLDCLRVTQLHRTLPTRQPEARIRITDDMRLAFNWPETCEGDALPDGNQLAFFQPKDWLGHLAPDGASTVCREGANIFCSDSAGIQCSPAIHDADVGWRVDAVETEFS